MSGFAISLVAAAVLVVVLVVVVVLLRRRRPNRLSGQALDDVGARYGLRRLEVGTWAGVVLRESDAAFRDRITSHLLGVPGTAATIPAGTLLASDDGTVSGVLEHDVHIPAVEQCATCPAPGVQPYRAEYEDGTDVLVWFCEDCRQDTDLSLVEDLS